MGLFHATKDIVIGKLHDTWNSAFAAAAAATAAMADTAVADMAAVVPDSSVLQAAM